MAAVLADPQDAAVVINVVLRHQYAVTDIDPHGNRFRTVFFVDRQAVNKAVLIFTKQSGRLVGGQVQKTPALPQRFHLRTGKRHRIQRSCLDHRDKGLIIIVGRPGERRGIKIKRTVEIHVFLTDVISGSLNIFFPEQDPLSRLTFSVILGVVVCLLGIAIIGVAGSMKSASLSEEEKKAAVKDFNFPKGLAIALLAGFMSGCFNMGLTFGEDIKFAETNAMFAALPAICLVTLGGFVTNAIYCFYQNQKNKTWGDYKKGSVWGNNLVFCALAGALWYSQFFGLSLGQSFFEKGGTMFVLSFCILMALNVVFSNVWGIILKEWKGCSGKTIGVLIAGIVVLIISTFLPTIIDSLSK